jgi:protein MpaA
MLDGWRVEEVGRSRDGLPLRAFLPGREPPLAGLLIAALHGEEPETLLMARRLLERVTAGESGWAIVPCANPDGVVAGTRQNASGVDVNRNFPAANWSDAPSFTYPPGCLDRRSPNRTNRSSPGEGPGSEPETQAVIALVERLRPALLVDLHSPLACIVTTPTVPPAVVGALAASAELPVVPSTGSATPGALRDWCADQGQAAITYEVEHAPLPALCARHLPGLEALLREG